MTDIVDRLRRWTHDPLVPPASDLMDEAADEIARLRGELVLWKAAAKLTTAEQVSLAVAIDHLGGLHCGKTAKLARELRFILERLTFPVPEPVPKKNGQRFVAVRIRKPTKIVAIAIRVGPRSTACVMPSAVSRIRTPRCRWLAAT